MTERGQAKSPWRMSSVSRFGSPRRRTRCSSSGSGATFRSGARVEWPRLFYRDLVAPNLVSNGCVWIPVSMAVFAFPLPLQIQVSGFAAAFWTLMCLQIGVRTARKEERVS